MDVEFNENFRELRSLTVGDCFMTKVNKLNAVFMLTDHQKMSIMDCVVLHGKNPGCIIELDAGQNVIVVSFKLMQYEKES